MKSNSLYLLVIVALIGYIFLKPKPVTVPVSAPAQPVPTVTVTVTSQTSPMAAAAGGFSPAPGQCVTPAELEEAKKGCREQAEGYAKQLQDRYDALEKQVTDSFVSMADDWTKARDKRADERGVIVGRIKSEVLSACGH